MQTNIHLHQTDGNNQRVTSLKIGLKLLAFWLLSLISHYLCALRWDWNYPTYSFHSNTSLPHVDYKYFFFSQRSSEAVQYVCVHTRTLTHTYYTHSRRVFISDSWGMIGLCRYAFVPLWWTAPTTPPGVLCILYKLTTSIPATPSLLDTHTQASTDTQIPP